MNKAREAGADETAIRDAVQVGLMVRKGAATRFDKETTPLLEG
jgi:hypothetical protein